LSPALSSCDQCVTVNLDVNQSLTTVGNANINIYCRPNGSDTYVSYSQFALAYPPPCAHAYSPITIKYGDTICYSNQISTYGSNSSSSFCLKSPVSTSDLSPSIDVSKCTEIIMPNSPSTTTTSTTTTTTTTTFAPLGASVTAVKNNNNQYTLTTNVTNGSGGNYFVIYYSTPTFKPSGAYTDAGNWHATNTGNLDYAPQSSVVTYYNNVSGSVYMQVRVDDQLSGQQIYGKLTFVWSGGSMMFAGQQWQNTTWF